MLEDILDVYVASPRTCVEGVSTKWPILCYAGLPRIGSIVVEVPPWLALVLEDA